MKKVLSLLMVITITISIVGGVTVSAEETSETYHYVSFGASNTNGYGLEGYCQENFYKFIGTKEQTEEWDKLGFEADAWDPYHKLDIAICGYNRATAGSYPVLIQEKLREEGKNAELDQFAMSATRAEDLRVLLDNSYEGDAFTKWRLYDPEKEDLENPKDYEYDKCGGVAKMRTEVQNAVREADLITYDMGANNFGVYLSLRLMYDKFDDDFAEIYGEEAAAEFYDMRKKVEDKVIELFDGVLTEETFITIDKMTDTLAYALLGYCYNFDRTMEIIRKLNNNADIVVLSIQNNIADVDVSYKGLKLPLGEMLGFIYDMANIYMTSISEYRDEYVFADVREEGHVELFFDEMKRYNGDPYSLNRCIIDAFNILDEDMYLQIDVTRALEKRGVEILPDDPDSDYNRALYAAYDVMASLIQAGACVDAMSLDGILEGADIGNVEDELLDSIQKAYLGAANYAIDHPDKEYDTEGVIQSILCDDIHKAIAYFGIRTELGNSFYAHPNYNGHKQLFDAVVTALENQTTGDEALINAILGLKDKLIDFGVTYGIEGAKTIFIKLFEALELNDASDAINRFFDTEKLADYVISMIDVSSVDKTEQINQILKRIIFGLSGTTADKNIRVKLDSLQIISKVSLDKRALQAEAYSYNAITGLLTVNCDYTTAETLTVITTTVKGTVIRVYNLDYDEKTGYQTDMLYETNDTVSLIRTVLGILRSLFSLIRSSR